MEGLQHLSVQKWYHHPVIATQKFRNSLPTGQKKPPESFLSEVNFISKFALILFGGQLELVKNAIIIDKWLKFKASSDEESANAVLILSLRDLLDQVILENMTFASSFSEEEKARTIERHRRVIQVVRMILSDER